MAYELTAAVAPSGNIYAIVAAAVIDTARAAAKTTVTNSGEKVTQRQLGTDEFSKMIEQVAQGGGLDKADLGSVFSNQLARRASGQYDLLTSQETTKVDQKSTTKRSVICTELLRRDLVHPWIYKMGEVEFEKLDRYTKLGYWSFAHELVRKMQSSPRLVAILAYLFRSRYLSMLGRRNLVGSLMISVGQPMCYAIGRIRYAFN